MNPAMTPLSPDSLRRLADWWMMGEEDNWSRKATTHMYSVYPVSYLRGTTNEDRAILCLLEAEFLASGDSYTRMTT